APTPRTTCSTTRPSPTSPCCSPVNPRGDGPDTPAPSHSILPCSVRVNAYNS
ncbi:hypothetical protein IscW_ISCW019152, partial [Ixodes scapularis]